MNSAHHSVSHPGSIILIHYLYSSAVMQTCFVHRQWHSGLIGTGLWTVDGTIRNTVSMLQFTKASKNKGNKSTFLVMTVIITGYFDVVLQPSNWVVRLHPLGWYRSNGYLSYNFKDGWKTSKPTPTNLGTYQTYVVWNQGW